MVLSAIVRNINNWWSITLVLHTTFIPLIVFINESWAFSPQLEVCQIEYDMSTDQTFPTKSLQILKMVMSAIV